MSFQGSPVENVTYAYEDATRGRDGIGRAASVADDSGSISYRYDARGRALDVSTPGERAGHHVCQRRANDEDIAAVHLHWPEIFGFSSAAAMASRVRPRASGVGWARAVARASTVLPARARAAAIGAITELRRPGSASPLA